MYKRQPICQRLVRSGKYCDFVLKFDYTITISGFPIDYNGLFMGVRHDSEMHRIATRFRRQLYPWEFGLGDKAYIGWPHLYQKPRIRPFWATSRRSSKFGKSQARHGLGQ